MREAVTSNPGESGASAVGDADPRLAEAASAARAVYRLRGLRNEVFGHAMFSDPAWDILLDLFIAECDGNRLSVSAACVGARCPSATALRYINLMVEADWIYRVADAGDGRRFYLVLRPDTLNALCTILADTHNRRP